MPGIHDYGLFIGSAFLLNLTPGPDTLYILGRSMAQGQRAGVASVLGISTGILVHTLAAALGLSAVLVTAPLIFDMIKYGGAAYLAYLGLRMLLARGGLAFDKLSNQTDDVWTIFRQGVITNVLNPKVALFFLALLPQFIDPAAPQPILSFMILGLTFVTTGTLWCMVLVLFASSFNSRIKQNPRLSLGIHRATGALFIALGLKLALVSSHP